MMTGHWAWALLVVLFAGGVAVGGLVVSLAGSRREDRAYDEGRADERNGMGRRDDDDLGRPGADQPGQDSYSAPSRPEGGGFRDDAGLVGRGPGGARAGSDSDGPDGMEAAPGAWEPEPEDRVYQWAHPHPIRATAPLTVIDWDALPWEERQLLTVWDWGRRMQAWVEDWDRDRLEAA